MVIAWGLTGLCCHKGEQVCIEDLVSRTLRLTAGQIPQVQQTDCQWRQQPQQADQTVSALDLTRFETAPRFETLVVVFHDPAVLIPPDALPGLLKRRRGDRGHQDPFQRLFAGGCLLFPDPDRPPLRAVLCRSASRSGLDKVPVTFATTTAQAPWTEGYLLEEIALLFKEVDRGSSVENQMFLPVLLSFCE